MVRELDPKTIEDLRALLKPRRERYEFTLVMQRLTAEVWADNNEFEWYEPPQGEGPTVPREEWGALEAQLIADLTGLPIEQVSASTDGRRRGRPRVDKARYAALLVGVVFHEYTLKPPKRIWDVYKETDENSPFFVFAAAVFRMIGLEPSVQAFREVGERWDRSRGFRKRLIERILFDGLSRKSKRSDARGRPARLT
jgi:hypothetical protein